MTETSGQFQIANCWDPCITATGKSWGGGLSAKDGACHGSGLSDGRCLVQLSFLDLADNTDPAQHLVHGVGGQRLRRVPDRTVGNARRLRRQVEHVVTVADRLRTDQQTTTDGPLTSRQRQIGINSWFLLLC